MIDGYGRIFGMKIIGKYPRNRGRTVTVSTVNTINSIRAGLRIKSGLLAETPANNRPNHSLVLQKFQELIKYSFPSKIHGELTEPYQFL